MSRYLIWFPSAAMHVAPDDLPAVSGAAHAVVDAAKQAGVLVFTGGIDETIEPVLVEPDGTVVTGEHPGAPALDGGFAIIDVPSRENAVSWAARLAAACRCPQEVRAFAYDPLA